MSRDTITLDHLSKLISDAKWFSRAGTFIARPGMFAVRDFNEFDDWDWLPTSREQVDPVHGAALLAEIEKSGNSSRRREAEMAAVRQVLISLRPVADRHSALVRGPDDLTTAAKAGAQYAARMASREVIAHCQGLWCDAVALYAEGFWPCGLTHVDHELVVY
jgi:hypothetical protein